MGKEIERKFLVKNNQFTNETVRKTYYKQGYIPTVNGMTVRVRIAGDQGFVTFKDHAVGFSRHEFEYPIPLADAEQMLALMCAKPQIEKHRYIVPAMQSDAQKSMNKQTATEGASALPHALQWEVDVFHGDNEGLIVAEIEVPTEDTQFDLPTWIGEEVTGIKKYYNSHLCNHPFKEWLDADQQ